MLPGEKPDDETSSDENTSDSAFGLKQLFLAKPTKGYILLDGTQKVEFNHIYFITFMVRREDKKKRKNSELMNDDGKMTVYIGKQREKDKNDPDPPGPCDGGPEKERGIRVFECNEAEVHLARPLAVHMDGESCMCQQKSRGALYPGSGCG